jgi:hypothetical protein
MGLSLILCDQVLEDKHTGKKSLIGLFDRIHAPSFPCMHASLSIFVSLTNLDGEVPCEISCRHASGEPVAFSAKGRINFPDPGRVAELVFHFKNVRFPEAGTYWLTFVAADMPVMVRPLFVQHLKQEPPAAAKPGDSTGNG